MHARTQTHMISHDDSTVAFRLEVNTSPETARSAKHHPCPIRHPNRSVELGRWWNDAVDAGPHAHETENTNEYPT